MNLNDNLKLSKIVLNEAYSSLINMTDFKDSIVGSVVQEMRKQKKKYEEKFLMEKFFSNIGYSYELPDFLYHYTSLDVLSKIVENNEMFLFDSLTSNDLYEKKHGEGILDEILETNIIKLGVGDDWINKQQKRILKNRLYRIIVFGMEKNL